MKLQFDAGTEKWVPWAKQKLAQLSNLRGDLNLPKLLKVFQPASGTLVYVCSAEYGSWIRITGADFIPVTKYPYTQTLGISQPGHSQYFFQYYVKPDLSYTDPYSVSVYPNDAYIPAVIEYLSTNAPDLLYYWLGFLSVADQNKSPVTMTGIKTDYAIVGSEIRFRTATPTIDPVAKTVSVDVYSLNTAKFTESEEIYFDGIPEAPDTLIWVTTSLTWNGSPISVYIDIDPEWGDAWVDIEPSMNLNATFTKDPDTGLYTLTGTLTYGTYEATKSTVTYNFSYTHVFDGASRVGFAYGGIYGSVARGSTIHENNDGYVFARAVESYITKWYGGNAASGPGGWPYNPGEWTGSEVSYDINWFAAKLALNSTYTGFDIVTAYTFPSKFREHYGFVYKNLYHPPGMYDPFGTTFAFTTTSQSETTTEGNVNIRAWNAKLGSWDVVGNLYNAVSDYYGVAPTLTIYDETRSFNFGDAKITFSDGISSTQDTVSINGDTLTTSDSAANAVRHQKGNILYPSGSRNIYSYGITYYYADHYFSPGRMLVNSTYDYQDDIYVSVASEGPSPFYTQTLSWDGADRPHIYSEEAETKRYPVHSSYIIGIGKVTGKPPVLTYDVIAVPATHVYALYTASYFLNLISQYRNETYGAYQVYSDINSWLSSYAGAVAQSFWQDLVDALFAELDYGTFTTPNSILDAYIPQIIAIAETIFTKYHSGAGYTTEQLLRYAVMEGSSPWSISTSNPIIWNISIPTKFMV